MRVLECITYDSHSMGRGDAIEWQNRTASQLRDQRYPGMKLEQVTQRRGSLLAGTQYCDSWILMPVALPSGQFVTYPAGVMQVVLFELP